MSCVDVIVVGRYTTSSPLHKISMWSFFKAHWLNNSISTCICHRTGLYATELGSVARSNARPPSIQTIADGFDLLVRQNILKWILVIKTMSTAIPSLQLIQVGQLPVADQVLVILTLNDLLDMTIVVNWDVNPQNKQSDRIWNFNRMLNLLRTDAEDEYGGFM